MIRPVGSTRSSKVDLRFLAATNRDLFRAVREGRFREDLYYRINTITLLLPPLRDRKEDIPLVVGHYLIKYAKEFQRNVMDISADALSAMINYSWPGNIRELQNVIERAILISTDSCINLEHLPESMRIEGAPLSLSSNKKLTIEEYAKAFILKYQSRYTEQQLASMLGITRKSLWEKRKKWGIPKS
jgi:transcriptional regulator with PAS, ATPase and Fis domain